MRAIKLVTGIINNSTKSPAEWANMLNISEHAIYKWLRGEVNKINPKTVIKITQHEGIGIKWVDFNKTELQIVRGDAKQKNQENDNMVITDLYAMRLNDKNQWERVNLETFDVEVEIGGVWVAKAARNN